MKLNMGQNRGPLYLDRDPLVASEAATKAYVDNTVSSHATGAGLHLTTEQNTMLDSLSGVSSSELNYLGGVTSKIQTQLDDKLALAGGTMTGALELWANPTSDSEAANKAYVDSADALKVNKAGDTLTGFLTLHAAPTANLHAVTKQYVDAGLSSHEGNFDLHLGDGERTWLSAVIGGLTTTEILYMVGVSSGVQGQLDSKLSKAGGTMTGAIVLAADPAFAMEPATKQYTDAADALKVDKSGDTMSGFLTLHADPTDNLHPATKQYADSTLSTHANDESVHLTTAQNAYLDAITVSASEVNSLTGISSNVQAQIDTKFDIAGGSITGDVTLAEGKTVFVSKTPVAGTELVNKAYVDSMIVGQRWEDPIQGSNLVAVNFNGPVPTTPPANAVYIVGDTGAGAWAGYEGHAVTLVDGNWTSLLGRTVQVGDRFGVGFATDSGLLDASVSGNASLIVNVTTATVGSVVVTAEAVQESSTTLVFNGNATDFGVTYTYRNSSWTATNTSVNLVAGNALDMTGNTLDLAIGAGLEFDGSNNVAVKAVDGGPISSSVSGVGLVLDGATLTKSASGLKLTDGLLDLINDSVQKSGTNTVSGSIAVSGVGATLSFANSPLVDADVTNKLYVDTAVTTLTNGIAAVSGIVSTLNTDPVTKTYVDNQDDLKVNKVGDTLTGFLTLHADPESALQAVTKQYADSVLSTHSTNDSRHLLVAERNWLTEIVSFVSSAEVNYLAGVTSAIQEQIDTKVAKAGDTMTGALILHADPTTNNMAATKLYVDNLVATSVAKAGDTMTGFLVLHADPTANFHPVTKQYSDTNLSSHATDTTLHLSSEQNTLLDSLSGISASELNYLSGLTSNVQDQLTAKLDKSGGIMTGAMSLSADPVSALQPATKQYTDAADDLKVNKAGDTLTGFLTLHAAPTDNLHAATKLFVETAIGDASASLGGDVSTKVNKAGDTMTGFLTLSANPTAALHAATKDFVETEVSAASGTLTSALSTTNSNVTQLRSDVDGLLVDPVTKTYVDNQDNLRLSKSGGTMTGYVTLNADPLNALHPATKQYVDTVAQGLVAKPSVRLATTVALDATYSNGTAGVNATLTGTSNGALVVDGKTTNVNDRILVRMQVDQIKNGDYVVQQTGDANSPFILKRTVTADESSEVPRSYFYVFDGDTLKGTGWTLSVADSITFTIGTDAIGVNQFSGQGSLIAGDGMTISGNTIQVNSANSQRIVVTADDIDLATTGVTPGTYTKLVVDGFGRATSGSNPTTLGGYGIADGQPLHSFLTDISGFKDGTSAGFLVVDSFNQTVALQTLSVNGSGLAINNGGTTTPGSGPIIISLSSSSAATGNTLVYRDVNGDFSANTITAALAGNADSATVLAVSQNFSADSADMAAPAVAFNGSASVQLAPVLKVTGVAAGTYTKVTTDTKGRITAAENPTTLGGYGITDGVTISQMQAEIDALRAELLELYNYVQSRI